jgi:hypothetical protein
MSKLRRFWVLLLAAALMVGFAGCPDEEDNKDTGNGIDYTNYADYSIRVKNDSNKNLVAFLGSPSSDNEISGIPKGGSVHGLKKDTRLFPNSGSPFDYILFLVTEEDYLANKNNLPSLENKPFTKLYAYHNVGSPNALVYTVNGLLGGNSKIILQNNTAYNVELRNNGRDGAIIGYSRPENYNIEFFVQPDRYKIFPVFRKFNPALGTIVSAFPEYPPGSQLAGRAKNVEFSLDNQDREFTIDVGAFVSGINITAGAAFLIIQNNAFTGVGFWDGGTRQITEAGGDTINPNRFMTFPILMGTQPGTDDQYYASRLLGQIYIGPSDNRRQLDPFTFENNKIYRIIVSGDAVTGNITFSDITYESEWAF